MKQQDQSSNSVNHNQGAGKMVVRTRQVSAWVLIMSAVFFGVISIMAIWGVIANGGDVAWKSVASLAVIGLSALVVNVGAQIYEGKVK